MSDLTVRTRNTIVALGIAQGLLLLLVHTLLQRNLLNIPQDAVWLLPWYAIAIGVPTALQLMVNDPRERRIWLFGLGLAAVLALTGAYAGHAVEPTEGISSQLVVVPYVLTTLIGWYVLLPFAQSWLKTGSLRPVYTDLFEFAWNNVITLLIAMIFTGIFWMLLGLWAALFKVIGLMFFADLFSDKYFVYLVTATVFAFALYLGRSHAGAVVTVRRIILAIFKGLLPLLAVIIVLFLTALPFMGLKPLWDTGKATALMLTLQIFLVIFLNAVFQNGQGEAPYPLWLRMAMRIAVVLLPVYTALCFYALYLRIDQHGWSTDRFWAVLLTFVIGLYVLGYALSALRRQGLWMSGMAPVNITIAGVVVLLSVVVNSPLLDARRISLASQMARLFDGKTPVDKFDYKYLRFELGRVGNEALARLQQVEDHPQVAAIRSAAQQALLQINRWDFPREKIETTAQVAKHFSVFPRGQRLEESFLKYTMSNRCAWHLKRCLEVDRRCAVLITDLNQDSRKDYVVFRVSNRSDRSISVFEQTGTEWKIAGNFQAISPANFENIEQIEALLEKGDYATPNSSWKDLRLGEHTHHLDINSF